jgi:hypothetical protein
VRREHRSPDDRAGLRIAPRPPARPDLAPQGRAAAERFGVPNRLPRGTTIWTMDAGLAALLGAAVGSLTTLGAAIVNARAQARTQHVQWRRQHRRDAYAAYLSALHDRDIVMDEILDALQADQPDLPALDETVRHFIARAREVHRAAEVVILEGPPSIVEAADPPADPSARSAPHRAG